ncbi:MAG: DNA topoisomerase VI subunit B [Sedimentisphaerales bacterium]|nr:DNA topoisomerase VI subunit B [Sedimentisphaerales bacterium]
MLARKKKKDAQGQLSFSFEEGSSPKTPGRKKTRPSSADSGQPRSGKRTTPAKKKKTVVKHSPKKSARKSSAAKKKEPLAIPGEASKTDTPSRSKSLPEPIKDDQIAAKAQAMASRQREISVSEFFAKNRHLLGFDNPSKALLTAVKEAVDNSLDACEEAHILPDIEVGIKQTAENRFLMWVQDNGPGIVKTQIPNIFGRLLYGSKFHSLRMARGQQGIGISAAGMYGLLTTGKSVKINSKTGPKSKAHHYELRIDTQKNRPDIINDEVIEWDMRSGTRVEIELEGRYQRGRQSVDEYLSQTAITNPHARFRYIMPDGQERIYERSVEQVVTVPKAVKPHPFGVELGILIKMAKDTTNSTMASFLCNEFSRVSPRVSQEILDAAKISARKRPKSLTHTDMENLYKAISQTKIMAPSTNCVVPIGEEALQKGLEQVVQAEFYTVCTRPPSVYRGNPFQIEAGLAYGGGTSSVEDEEENNNGVGEQQLMRVLRFANRVPLLYQQSACAIFKSIMQTNWRLYGLSQSKGALPAGPITVIVHMASVWVPFTSESKEAVAHYPEIIKEIKLALAECGRRLGRYLRGQKRKREEALKRSYIEKYLPAIGEALRDILTLKDRQVNTMLANLEHVLERSRTK